MDEKRYYTLRRIKRNGTYSSVTFKATEAAVRREAQHQAAQYGFATVDLYDRNAGGRFYGPQDRIASYNGSVWTDAIKP